MLEKYHKQKIDKHIRKKYELINKQYDLGYDTKNEFDLIKLSIFETSLRQKKKIESIYESVRSSLFDMWEHLSFYERNDLIRLELDKVINNLNSFEFEATDIYIPFFDPLLNKLYIQEIAILELPQFLKLYHDFNERLIPIEYYGLNIYKNGFSMMQEIGYNENEVVLYYPNDNIFYKINKDGMRRFPILKKAELSENDLTTLAELLLNDKSKFIDYLIDKEFVKKRFIKKIIRKRRKNNGK